MDGDESQPLVRQLVDATFVAVQMPLSLLLPLTVRAALVRFQRVEHACVAVAPACILMSTCHAQRLAD